jgi:DNA invertase Pin-like site-specific DNA recombinase
LVSGTISLDIQPQRAQCERMNESISGSRVALYARVSTKDKGQNPDVQLADLRDYAKLRGWQVAGEFVDVGISGSKDSRPQLDAMMRLAKARKIDIIAVWKLDRFGRSLKHLVNALADLQAVGVAFVSYSDNVDLSTPSGRLMFNVIGAMAEFERELIRERVRAGLAHARAEGTKSGKAIGRPRARRERDRDAKRIRQMRDEGQSYREIAEELGRSTMDVYRVGMTLGCAGA